MPSRRAHRYVTRLFLGKEFDEVHKAIDAPSKKLGPSHRKLFHSYDQAARLATLVSGDPAASYAGALHVRLDELCSKDPVFASIVELGARLDARRRHRSRRRSVTR